MDDDKVTCGICGTEMRLEDAFLNSEYTYICISCDSAPECVISGKPCIRYMEEAACDDCPVAIDCDWKDELNDSGDSDSVVMLQRLREREFGL